MLCRLTLSFSVLCCKVLVVHLVDKSKEATTAHSLRVETSKLLVTVDDDTDLKYHDWTVWCKLQPNGNDCTGHGNYATRYYYDMLLEDCKTFFYGKCKSSYNNFNTITECHETCRAPGGLPMVGANFTDKVFCRLQPEFGSCHEYHPMFYFDITSKKCKGFSYSGCGGNGNRFPNAQICTHVCLKLMEPEINY